MSQLLPDGWTMPLSPHEEGVCLQNDKLLMQVGVERTGDYGACKLGSLSIVSPAVGSRITCRDLASLPVARALDVIDDAMMMTEVSRRRLQTRMRRTAAMASAYETMAGDVVERAKMVAERFGVTLATVRNALSRARRHGLLAPVHGSPRRAAAAPHTPRPMLRRAAGGSAKGWVIEWLDDEALKAKLNEAACLDDERSSRWAYVRQGKGESGVYVRFNLNKRGFAFVESLAAYGEAALRLMRRLPLGGLCSRADRENVKVRREETKSYRNMKDPLKAIPFEDLSEFEIGARIGAQWDALRGRHWPGEDPVATFAKINRVPRSEVKRLIGVAEKYGMVYYSTVGYFH